nr:transposase [Candidatus Njordarchaeota archaeon]
KLNNLATQTIHELSNVIVTLAEAYECSVIVLEDLRFSEVEKGLGLLSWMLSRWPRGYVHQCIKYKAALRGIRVETVPARDTSRRCPRCGAYGVHIKSWSDISEVEAGGFFLCRSCHFMGDRDYVGALNVGRAYCADLEASGGTLGGAKPSIYMLEANPLANRSVRGAGLPVSRENAKPKATTFSTITLSGRIPPTINTLIPCTI